MGFFGWLILSLGALAAVHGSKCVPETAVCSHYWARMEPHKNLLESEEELNSWCRKQSLFFSCLEDVLLGIYGNYSKFPTNVLVSKMFTEDLCFEGSTSRKRYLDNAACINQLDMEYCSLPEYLEIVTPDGSVPPTKCSSAEKTFSCIAATMVIKCGFDAGRVYRYLLKVTKYGEEVCAVESSGNILCDEDTNSEDKLTEMYYGLLNRIGSIPEQVTEAGSMDETESISVSMISEFLNKALDDIEYSESNVQSERLTSGSEAKNRSTDESRKWPVIIEQFKGLLFYNYSNEKFEFYWRQPGSFPIDRVTCEHVLTPHMKGVLLECVVHHRSEEPECYYDTKPTTTERVTPELIRDIDVTIPWDSSLDISERLYLTDYLRDYQLYRMSWEYWINARLVMEIDDMRIWKKHYAAKYPNNKVCAKELRYYDIINDRNVSWWQCPSLFSDELRNEIVTFLYGKRTVDDVLFLSVFNENDKSYVHLYEPLLHAFDGIVCERVDECHPRGRGVFKCSLKRRDLTGCDYCCDYAKPDCNRKKTEVKSTSKTFSSSGEGSGVSEDSSVHLVEEATMRTEESTDLVTGVVGEDGELVALDLSELKRDSESSDVNLMLLSQNSEASSENAFLARSGVLSNEVHQDNLYEHELELSSNDNIFVLHALPSVADLEAAYEIAFED